MGREFNAVAMVGGIDVRWDCDLPAIQSFRGEYFFLSNFYPALTYIDGIRYYTSEHAYQAQKAADAADRALIAGADSPGAAKRAARGIKLRAEWESIKELVMWRCLASKFNDPKLRLALERTAPRKLVEGNHWGDTYWGVCKGRGENRLGLYLMLVRQGSLPP